MEMVRPLWGFICKVSGPRTSILLEVIEDYLEGDSVSLYPTNNDVVLNRIGLTIYI